MSDESTAACSSAWSSKPMLALGIGLVALASKLFRQRLWAVVLALALSALGAIGR